MANIKKIAQALVLLSFGELSDVAEVLEEEFGIEPQKEDDKKFVLRTGDLENTKRQAEIIQARLKEEQERRQKPYAPRKIGNPRGFPKNMRRK